MAIIVVIILIIEHIIRLLLLSIYIHENYHFSGSSRSYTVGYDIGEEEIFGHCLEIGALPKVENNLDSYRFVVVTSI